MRRKVCVVVTSRASYARIKTALRAIQTSPHLELQLVVGASAVLERYGSAANVMERDGFPIAERVYMVVEGENNVAMAKTTGLGLLELATAFDNLRPDVVVSVADRFETLATAVAASYLNIPVAHIQGGELTGSIDDRVRHAVTKLANLHFVASEGAARRVIQMGEHPRRVFTVGCPSVDLAAEVMGRRMDNAEFTRYGGVGGNVDITGKFAIVMHHPVTTESQNALEQASETLEAIHALQLPTIWFWPNVDAGSDLTSKGIRSFRERHHLPFIHFIKNMPPEPYLVLLNQATVIVGNSSVAIREAAFLGVRAVNVGTRQRGRERGCNVVDVPYDRQQIATAIRDAWESEKAASSPVYGTGQAGARIAEVLETVDLQIEKPFYDVAIQI